MRFQKVLIVCSNSALREELYLAVEEIGEVREQNLGIYEARYVDDAMQKLSGETADPFDLAIVDVDLHANHKSRLLRGERLGSGRGLGRGPRLVACNSPARARSPDAGHLGRARRGGRPVAARAWGRH